MGVTLNKDGKPRKIGSGKTKGAGCFAKIKWEHLKEFIKEDDDILVGRVWLRSVGALNQMRGSKKKKTRSVSTPNPSPRPIPTQPSSRSFKKPEVLSTAKIDKPVKDRGDMEDYDPPPLFASVGEIKKY